jgi:oligopeptide transport system ATP-binding protein
VEEGQTAAIFDHPSQDYTRTLMAAAMDDTRFSAAPG